MSLEQPSRRAFLAGSVVTLGAGGAYYLTRSDDTAQHLSPSFHSSDETSAFGVDLGGKPIMGSRAAPLEIYYWTDFQCPFCERFERETLPDLVREYVEPGDVRIVFVSVPYFGADSMTAAVAGKCVWERVRDDDPGAYWDWHTAVFDEQGEKNSGWASTDNLLEYTRSVDGVDADALESCLEDRRSEFEAAVEADAERATEFGISGTPSFVVFDPESEAAGSLTGAQPPERFDDAIERVRDA
ncbi:thioredoxin domain-containing protein [Natrinema thermotolerans]|uniref:Thioredoxin domain-containing protein n=1 Tax=Natrinema thermotolerans TaxID=121872 RepID=A0AAF0PEF9_9EURY|nr:thioredoxin domain-containing protein [Natrinema thermotolerans]QCC60155.1 disulfide bond formation protein DsbA [Natrinema thermotolerans]QCC61067.1 disulfide bond formation protein DsbA [Natrinema thermotolerans]WMT07168.1 thioredoxin domain-containing protein [Natrinema thermotolerans]